MSCLYEAINGILRYTLLSSFFGVGVGVGF